MDEERKEKNIEPDNSKKPRSFYVKLIIAYAIVILLILLFVNYESFSNTVNKFLMVLNPIIYGLIIAYLCNPILKLFFGKVFKKIKSVYWRKALSMIMTYLIVLFLIFGVVAVLVQQLMTNVQTFLENVEGYATNTETAIVDFIDRLPFIKSEAELKAEKEAKEAAEKAKNGETTAATEPVAEPASEATTEDTAAESGTEQATEPITDLVTEPVIADPDELSGNEPAPETEVPGTQAPVTTKNPDETQKLSDVVEDISDTPVSLLGFSTMTKESVISFINDTLTGSTNVLRSLGNTVIQSGTTAASVVINFVLGLIFSAYVLAEKEMLCAKAKKLTTAIFKPDKAPGIIAFSHYTDQKIGHFIRGKILESIIVGIIAYVSFVIFRIPTPLVIAIIVAVMNIIPVFGPFLGAIPAALLVFLIDPGKTIPYIIIVIIIMQINGNYISPRIVGTSTGLTSLGAITALILMSGFFGIIGMFIGIPLIAIVIELLWRNMNKRLEEKNLSIELDDYYSPEFAEVLEDEKAKRRRRNLTALTVDSTVLLFKKIFKKDNKEKDKDKKDGDKE